MATLYAATGNHVVRLTSSDAQHWETERLLEDVGVQCVAIDPDDPSRLYAGTFDQGLYRSIDAGASWENVTEGIPHNRIPSIAISPSAKANGKNVVYAGTEPSSLYISEDDGATWRDSPTLRDLPSAPTWSFPPRPWTSHVRWIALSAHDPELIFAGIELGGVMRSADGGVTWEDRKPGSYHDSHAILTHPVDSTRVYEAAGGGVATSFDAGDSWTEVDDGMDRHYAWGLAVDPGDPDLWYVSASYGARYAHGDHESAQAVIYRKRGDAPWEALHNGLPDPMPVMPYALLTSQVTTGRIFAGTRKGGLYVSDDRGDSWVETDLALDGLLTLSEAPD